MKFALTHGQRDFLRALRPGDSVRVRSYCGYGHCSRSSFVVYDRAGDPVHMTARGWRARRWHVSMIVALARRGILTTKGTRPKGSESRYVLTKEYLATLGPNSSAEGAA